MLPKKVKASSLLNTVFVCLVVGIFCSVLIFISQANSKVFTKLERSLDVISRNTYDVSHYMAYRNMAESDLGVYSEEGIYTVFDEKPWGFYTVLTSKTYARTKDTLVKSFLLANTATNFTKGTSLYLPDYGDPLKYSGTVHMDGKLYIPNKKLKPNYLTNVKNTLSQKGAVYPSEARLPKRRTTYVITDKNDEESQLFIDEVIDVGTFINTFEKPTHRIILDGPMELKDITLKGNIVVSSKFPVVLGRTLSAQDIIVEAPEITIESGFKGRLQLRAERSVVVNEGALLRFPSGIYVKNKLDATQVHLKTNVTIQGAIVVEGSQKQDLGFRRITIDENAFVKGDIYCKGTLNLKGEIAGTVYTDYLLHETNGSKTTNLLYNTAIYSDRIPTVYPRLFMEGNGEEEVLEIIKEF